MTHEFIDTALSLLLVKIKKLGFLFGIERNFLLCNTLLLSDYNINFKSLKIRIAKTILKSKIFLHMYQNDFSNCCGHCTAVKLSWRVYYDIGI